MSPEFPGIPDGGSLDDAKNGKKTGENNMKFFNAQAISSLIYSSFAMVIVLLASGYASALEKIVVDEDGNKLSNILVVPFYLSTQFLVGFGPDGAGGGTEKQLIVTRPFVFNSGENFTSKEIPAKGIMLPMIYIGSSNYMYRMLFIKKGFVPKVESLSYTPMVLEKSSKNESAEMIDMLLAPKHDQDVLRELFKIEQQRKGEITVGFDEKDIELLKRAKEGI